MSKCAVPLVLVPHVPLRLHDVVSAVEIHRGPHGHLIRVLVLPEHLPKIFYVIVKS